MSIRLVPANLPAIPNTFFKFLILDEITMPYLPFLYRYAVVTPAKSLNLPPVAINVSRLDILPPTTANPTEVLFPSSRATIVLYAWLSILRTLGKAREKELPPLLEFREGCSVEVTKDPEDVPICLC